MRSLVAVALTAGILVAAGAAQSDAQDKAKNWPTRPLTMVVTFAAGSGDDLVARIIAPRMAEILGQPVLIENVGGAGGMNGASRVARAAPDGYQMVLGGTGTFGANQTLYKRPLYNAVTDFKPVALVVANEAPVSNLQEFIAYAKANEGKLQFGSGGAGSATHLACVLLNLAIGVKVTHVPYRSAVQAIEDTVGGRINYVCPITSTAVGQIQGKRVKAIAMLSQARSPVLPDLPTASEQGLAGFDAYIWNGIFVPKGTPDEIVKKLHDAAVAAMETPAVDQRIRQMAGVLVAPDRRSPEYLRQFVEDEIKKWAVPIRASGMTMD
jgi:tripartite-type tricarboxylate transporter receptor subunit TctC